MLYGIIAAEGNNVTPIGGGGLPTAVASADFVNQVYSYSGSSKTLADIITQTGNRSASGLVLGPSSTVLNDFLAVLNTLSWTVVVDFVPNSSGFTAGFNIIFVEGTRTAFADYCSFYTTTGYAGFFEQDDSANQRGFDYVTDQMTVDVPNKIACTRINSRASLSINGAAVLSSSSPLTTIATDTFVFCDTSASSMGFLRKIDIYSPQPDSILPTMSL